MKIKKSTIDQLVNEEMSAMVKEGLLSEADWGRMKRQFARGFTSTGDQNSWIGKFVRGIGSHDEAKAAIKALDDLEAALKNISPAVVKSIGSGGATIRRQGAGGEVEDIALASKTALKARNLGGSAMSIPGLAELAGTMREDLEAMFAQLGADAPERKAKEPEEPEEPAAAPEEPGMKRLRNIELDEGILRLKRQIRRKLRRFTS